MTTTGPYFIEFSQPPHLSPRADGIIRKVETDDESARWLKHQANHAKVFLHDRNAENSKN
jgi:hypothetical protein